MRSSRHIGLDRMAVAMSRLGVEVEDAPLGPQVEGDREESMD